MTPVKKAKIEAIVIREDKTSAETIEGMFGKTHGLLHGGLLRGTHEIRLAGRRRGSYTKLLATRCERLGVQNLHKTAATIPRGSAGILFGAPEAARRLAIAVVIAA